MSSCPTCPACATCPQCKDCDALVAAAIATASNTGATALDAVKAELTKYKADNEEATATITLLKKQLLEKTNEGAKAKAAGAKLEEELTQLKEDVHKLIGFWEPPPPSENSKNSLLAKVSNNSSSENAFNQAQ